MNVTEVGDLLAMINATLNATSAIALVTGFVFIRKKVVDKHRRRKGPREGEVWVTHEQMQQMKKAEQEEADRTD